MNVFKPILLLFCTALAWSQTTGPTLTVDASAQRHVINPDIYGIANYGLDTTFAKEIRLPNTRWGGDGTTRYNWQLDSSNAGFDWFFMGGNGSSNPIPSAGPDAMIRGFQPAGTRSLITIPIIPYINSLAAWNCSFPVSTYGPQQSTNPYVHPNGDNCGNSIANNGTQLLDTNIAANHIGNSPAFQQSWIDHFLSVFGSAAQGGVPYYQLDNEPGGWGNTHRDVQPGGANYDTIFNLGSEYAAMIKSTDSAAKVFGPSDFTLGGWIGSSSDMQAHNNLYAGQWYLQQMQAYQAQHGTRILDYFDEHVYGGSSSDSAYELESTRSLWDPTYNSGTWVEKYYLGNMQLIPRFHSWIGTYYPGTKLAFSEYSWGGLNTLVGALAEADILGIFGREQVDFANMWSPPQATDPGAYAFRLYRNYDGQGGAYGDTWVNAKSSNQSQLAIYGAQRTIDGALTLVVINKSNSALTSSIALSNFNANGTADFYTYSQANLHAIVKQPGLTVTSNTVTADFPAQSASVIVVARSGAALPRANWVASASSSSTGTYDSFKEQPAESLDGNIKSRWSSGRAQVGGEWFAVDLGAPTTISSIVMNAGPSTNDYARGYQVFLSNDGQNWGSAVAVGTGTTPLATISFATQTARYFKIEQTGKSGYWWWSIAEINVFP